MKDYYEILRVHPSVSGEEIKEAYRRLAHKHHPDMGGNEEEFKAIHEAYEVLSNPVKRTAYDNSRISAAHQNNDFTRSEIQRAEFKLRNEELEAAESILEPLAFKYNVPLAYFYLGTIKLNGVVTGTISAEQAMSYFAKAAAIDPEKKENYQRAFGHLAYQQIERIARFDLDAAQKARKLKRGAFGGIALGGLGLLMGSRGRRSNTKTIGDVGAVMGGMKAYNNFSQKGALDQQRKFYAQTVKEIVLAVRGFCPENSQAFQEFKEKISQIKTINI